MANEKKQENSGDRIKEDKKETGETERDVEIDMAKATDIARSFVKSNMGNLVLHQFRIEEVNRNGDNTKYIVICSVVSDLGEEREYFLTKVDVITGKLVSPAGRGKKIDGKLHLSEISLDPKWTE